ncbi:hypothetical protein [Nocardiopsis sp. CC223A]|nr:hypothetical protein [Nocardiopsis sp. CC223A]
MGHLLGLRHRRERYAEWRDVVALREEGRGEIGVDHDAPPRRRRDDL